MQRDIQLTNMSDRQYWKNNVKTLHTYKKNWKKKIAGANRSSVDFQKVY